MSSAANITNATSGGNTTISDTHTFAKLELEEGIVALEEADPDIARIHLRSAQEEMIGAPPDAIRHFEEGMKALDTGDNNGAIMHFNIANEALG